MGAEPKKAAHGQISNFVGCYRGFEMHSERNDKPIVEGGLELLSQLLCLLECRHEPSSTATATEWEHMGAELAKTAHGQISNFVGCYRGLEMYSGTTNPS